jgi:hypothetical protein
LTTFTAPSSSPSPSFISFLSVMLCIYYPFRSSFFHIPIPYLITLLPWFPSRFSFRFSQRHISDADFHRQLADQYGPDVAAHILSTSQSVPTRPPIYWRPTPARLSEIVHGWGVQWI